MEQMHSVIVLVLPIHIAYARNFRHRVQLREKYYVLTIKIIIVFTKYANLELYAMKS